MSEVVPAISTLTPMLFATDMVLGLVQIKILKKHYPPEERKPRSRRKRRRS